MIGPVSLFVRETMKAYHKIIPLTAGLFVGATIGSSQPEPAKADNNSAQAATAHTEYLTLYAKKKYSPLLLRLAATGVNSERLATLQTLLIRREVRLATAQMSTGQHGPELVEYLTQVKMEITREIEKSLGPEIKANVEHYIDTLPQRQLVNDLNQILVYSDATLTAQQFELLCDLLAKSEPVSPFAANRRFDERSITQRRLAYDDLLKKAAGLLSATQLRAFSEALDLQIAFMKSNYSK